MKNLLLALLLLAACSPNKPRTANICPAITIDTIYNYIDEPEPHPYDRDAMRVELDDLLRDDCYCLINQEVVIFIFWQPITEHSKII